MAVAAKVDELLDDLHHLVFRLAHADDDMGAEFLRSEDVAGLEKRVPVFLPGMRRLHALAACPVEQLGRGGIKRHGEDIRSHVAKALNVVAGHGGGVRQDRDRDRVGVDPVGPFLQDRDRVLIGIRVGDHRDAHPVEGRALHVSRNAVDDLVHRHGRPIDADEIAVGIVALALAVAGQAAIGAVGAAAFGIGQEKVEATGAGTAVHLPLDKAQGNRRGGRHLHILGRAHMRGHHPIVGAIEARGRDIGVFHRLAVAERGRRGAGLARLHPVVGVEVEAIGAGGAGQGAFGFETGHGCKASIWRSVGAASGRAQYSG